MQSQIYRIKIRRSLIKILLSFPSSLAWNYPFLTKIIIDAITLLAICYCRDRSISCYSLAGADDKLVVTGTDSKQTAISIADVSRITFNGDKMKIATTKGDLDYQLGAIDNLAFDLEASAADHIETSLRDDITLGISGGILSVSAPAGVPLGSRLQPQRGRRGAPHRI